MKCDWMSRIANFTTSSHLQNDILHEGEQELFSPQLLLSVCLRHAARFVLGQGL